jgi:hypothetical protein
MIRKHAILAALLTLSSGCNLLDGERRQTAPPSDLHNVALIDVSQRQTAYAPFDPQMITALKDALHAGCAVQPIGGADKQPPLNVLAISSGGSYGVFDVGVLHGWSASGTRPVFDVVTGVSTGALIATFAFLGPPYDDFLRQSYVSAKADDVYESRWLLSILCSDSIAQSAPLKKRIDAAITPKILKEIAEAHARGRRLYVGTTNLDTRRFIIWDMGAIASAGTPESLVLYRNIILASASVPGFFPPVLIDVEVDGRKFQELHVDGGTTSAVFLPMTAACDPKKLSARPGSHVYVISSGKLYADSDMVKRKFVTVTADAISAMVYSSARNDVFRIFNMALLFSVDFHLIAVPQDFPLNSKSLSFDPAEQSKLYDLGYEMGKTRKGWRETPPGAEVSEQVLPRTGTQFIAPK